MQTIKTFHRQLSVYFDVAYLLRFVLLFISIYAFNLMYVGLVLPVNLYSPFLDHYLNYIDGLRNTILFTSNQIAHAFGISSHIQHQFSLKVDHGTNLIVGDACLGLGVMSFWTAFIVADTTSLKRKLAWCLGGLGLIWIINCIRVAFILLAYEKNWKAVITMDHHTAFNILSYVLIFILILLYDRMKTGYSITQP